MKKIVGTVKRRRWTAAIAVAAFLSLGASVTSFAAGWQEEGGSWVFYNKDGSMVTNEWKKSGNNWYWLDSDGTMATDMVIEDDDYYYVDANGVMVTNQWVQVENTEDEDDDAPTNWWYYFTGNGKAYTANDSGTTSLKTINGKKYAFTDDGKMLFGWVDESSTRQTGDDAWTSCMYYMGDEDDGAATVGWATIHVIDDKLDWDESKAESEDQDYWFYFKRNCKKVAAKSSETIKTMKINGKKYGFDETGRMVYEWNQMSDSRQNVASSPQAAGSSVDGYYFFSDRDIGARVNEGWFKAVPSQNINFTVSDEEEDRWYYAYSVGKLSASDFKTIRGKRYAFDNSGVMLSGLQAVYKDGAGRIWNRELDEDELLKDGTSFASGGETSLTLVNENGQDVDNAMTVAQAVANCAAKEDEFGDKKPFYGVYYFGGEDDGAARTSEHSIQVDGESYSFCFKKDGTRKGEGINGIKDNYLYQNGRKIKADKDNKYEAFFIAANMTADETNDAYQNKYLAYCDEENSYIAPGYTYKVAPEMVNLLVSDIKNGIIEVERNRIYLVNTIGHITKDNKSAAKDGDGCYYETNNGSVTGYYSEEDGEKQYINPALNTVPGDGMTSTH